MSVRSSRSNLSIEVLGRRVAPVKARLIGHHAKARANRVEPLGNAKAVELDQAFIGAEDAPQAPQGGGLAGAVLAEKDEDLAALDMQVDARHGAHVAEALLQALDPDHRTR